MVLQQSKPAFGMKKIQKNSKMQEAAPTLAELRDQWQHLRELGDLIRLSLNAVQAGREAAAPILGPFHLLERKSSENMDKQLEVANTIKKLEKAQCQVAAQADAPAALNASSAAATGAFLPQRARQTTMAGFSEGALRRHGGQAARRFQVH